LIGTGRCFGRRASHPGSSHPSLRTFLAHPSALISFDFTTLDADPAIGSVATDSAIKKAINVRAKRIIVPSDAKIYRYQRP
jgi:hypothetical protein